jgi:hypothetical protein
MHPRVSVRVVAAARAVGDHGSVSLTPVSCKVSCKARKCGVSVSPGHSSGGLLELRCEELTLHPTGVQR